MIAPLRFFDSLQVLVELGAVVPGGAVNALQHRVMLVAAPICSRDARQLKGADRSRGLGVAAAT